MLCGILAVSTIEKALWKHVNFVKANERVLNIYVIGALKTSLLNSHFQERLFTHNFLLLSITMTNSSMIDMLAFICAVQFTSQSAYACFIWIEWCFLPKVWFGLFASPTERNLPHRHLSQWEIIPISAFQWSPRPVKWRFVGSVKTLI